ncbi:MAG: hypothetical protein ACMUJM_01825 [bacterium]
MLGGKGNNLLYYITLIITLFLLFANVRVIGINQRVMNLFKKVENIGYRRIEFNDKFFDLYINEKEKSITVHGEAENIQERNKIKEHFRLIAPYDYHIAYSIYLKNRN